MHFQVLNDASTISTTDQGLQERRSGRQPGRLDEHRWQTHEQNRQAEDADADERDHILPALLENIVPGDMLRAAGAGRVSDVGEL